MEICGFIGLQEIIIIFLVVFIPVFFIIPVVIALIDVLKSEFEGNNKIIMGIGRSFSGDYRSYFILFYGARPKNLKIRNFQSVFTEKNLLFAEYFQ